MGDVWETCGSCVGDKWRRVLGRGLGRGPDEITGSIHQIMQSIIC